MHPTERQVSNLIALKTIAETLNQLQDLKLALDQSLQTVLDVLGMKTGWIFLRNNVTREYELVAYHGLPVAMTYPGPAWEGPCRCSNYAREGRLQKAVNIVSCSRLATTEGDTDGLEIHASVPLRAGNRDVGILNVASASGDFLTEDDLYLLNTVGNQMGVAIERARQFERVRNQRLMEQKALLKLSNALLTTESTQTVVDEIVKVSAEIFKADVCLLLFPTTGGSTEVLANFGLTEEFLKIKEKTCYECSAYQAILPVDHAGHIVLDQSGDVTLNFSRMDEPVPEDVHQAIVSDTKLWQYWWRVGVRSIYLAPIFSISRQETIGLLVLGHKKAVQFDPADVHLADLLANQAALAIERARFNEIRLAQQVLEQELAMAHEIQQSLLPKTIPTIPGWDIATAYQSAKQIGGDFYDFIKFDDGQLGLIIADVAGKGIPAALVMAKSRTLIRAFARGIGTPAKAIYHANEMLIEDYLPDSFT